MTISKPQSKPSRLVQRAVRLARPRMVAEGVNMLSLSRQIFDLSEGQRDEFNDLAEQRDIEARKLIKGLNIKYNEKAETVLNSEQKKKYEAVNSALRDFRRKVRPRCRI